ncbi:MAG: hypothetical protein KF819_31795 [Labilithrix sp.]|nr:hypothetical protein [Labilithrix sp.]
MQRASTEPVSQRSKRAEAWPPLPLALWRDTYRTLHLYFQIVGKVKLALTPKTNQWWNVAFHLTANGLTTLPMPVDATGDVTVEIDFDFIHQVLLVKRSDGEERAIPLAPRSVKDFHRELFAALAELGVAVHIWPVPVEIPMTKPFTEDDEHRAYVPEHALRFWRVLRRVEPVLEVFRARYRGKCSPVHFFWGTCDLAVTRFSGRRAPPRAGSIIERDAYDEEVSSVGFWPGEDWAEVGATEAAFYAYAVPEPPGFSAAKVLPAEASYDPRLKELILPYEVVRAAPDPARAILDFAQSSYDAASTLGRWDRARLAYP